MLPVSEESTEWHFPGQNYTGPGTHIYDRVRRGVLPNNRTDAATLLHDVDYMIATNRFMAEEADNRAIKLSDYSPAGVATKLGLTIRKNLFPNSFWGGDPSAGVILKKYIKQAPRYVSRFRELGMSDALDHW